MYTVNERPISQTRPRSTTFPQNNCQFCKTTTDLLKLLIRPHNKTITVCPKCLDDLRVSINELDNANALDDLLNSGQLQCYPETKDPNKTVIWSDCDIASDNNIRDYILENKDYCIEYGLTTVDQISEILYEEHNQLRNDLIADLNHAIHLSYPDGMPVYIKHTISLWNRTYNTYQLIEQASGQDFLTPLIENDVYEKELYLHSTDGLILDRIHHDGTNTAVFYIIKPYRLEELREKLDSAKQHDDITEYLPYFETDGIHKLLASANLI